MRSGVVRTVCTGLPGGERRELSTREALNRRARAEFEELPGMRLTLPQCTRLLGAPRDVCLRVLESLIREGLVTLTADGHYANRQVETER
jgi:hypothetical protein